MAPLAAENNGRHCCTPRTFRAALGEAVASDGWNLVGALVDLEGDSFSTDYHLRDFAGEAPPIVLVRWVAQRLDAIWVRARIPSLFGFHPSGSELEKSLLDVGFLAVSTQDHKRFAYPFLCTDYYRRTGLTFGSPGPEESLKAAIASSFWKALLSAPDELSDYRQDVYHPGAGVWMHFACAHGDLSYSESEDELEGGV